jgi:hypothetical protein
MNTNTHCKNYEDCKEIQKEMDLQKRLCNLYGFCGKDYPEAKSHHVTHFGLNKLNCCK